MKTLLQSTTIALALLASAHAEERFEDVEKAYLKALYLKQKPILKQHLGKLEQARTAAAAKKLKVVLNEIDRDIAALKERIKTQDKALKALKDVEPLEEESGKSDATSKALHAIEASLTNATTRGGVHYDSSQKALVGWTSRQAEVSMPIPTITGVTYSVELSYGTSEKGRLLIAIGSQKFLLNLKDTAGLGKQANLHVGKFTANGTKTAISITLPIQRLKPFLHIHRLRLIPQRS